MNKFAKRKSVNIDISNKCSLQCPRCQREMIYRSKGAKVPGYDLSIDEFKKVAQFMDEILFCGQYSDPIHHPHFIDFLEICKNSNVSVNVHTASSSKKIDWYRNAFRQYPLATWIFGIDGLPKDSHKYRINQDGEKLFQIMLESKKYLQTTPQWQYIIFNYNENDVKEAEQIAHKNSIDFFTVISSRWLLKDDPYMPKNKELRMTPK